MTLDRVAAIASVTIVAIEIVLPGRQIYHAGWFNVALAAIVIVAIVRARLAFVRAHTDGVRIGVVAIALGATIAGTAGVASGLLGPDNRTVVGAPGEQTRLDDLGGSLVFPPAGEATNGIGIGDVVLERSHHAPLAIGDRGSYAGTFVFRTVPRTVVYVDVRDAGGGKLTITQPSGGSFLSPVLMMQHRQTIAGLNVPYDSFAVPAAHRRVTAVLFTEEEAAMMHGLQGGTGPAVLFAVDDENGRPLPRAIGALRSGTALTIGGLGLRAIVFAYPAVDVVAVPSLVAVIAGAVLVLGGLVTKGTDRDAPRP